MPGHFKHYIEIGPNGNVLFGWSDGPTDWKSTEGAICIREDESYQFRLFPDGEENPVLTNGMGIPLYHYNQETGEITLRSQEEIQADLDNIPPPPPTQMERLIADVNYIAAMTDIELDV